MIKVWIPQITEVLNDYMVTAGEKNAGSKEV